MESVLNAEVMRAKSFAIEVEERRLENERDEGRIRELESKLVEAKATVDMEVEGLKRDREALEGRMKKFELEKAVEEDRLSDAREVCKVSAEKLESMKADAERSMMGLRSREIGLEGLEREVFKRQEAVEQQFRDLDDKRAGLEEKERDVFERMKGVDEERREREEEEREKTELLDAKLLDIKVRDERLKEREGDMNSKESFLKGREDSSTEAAKALDRRGEELQRMESGLVSREGEVARREESVLEGERRMMQDRAALEKKVRSESGPRRFFGCF